MLLRRWGRPAAALALALSGLANVAAAPAPPVAPDSFIVVLRDGVDSRAVAGEHSARHRAAVSFVYEHALRGYAARLSAGALGAIAADGRVAYVERDDVATTQTTQSGATWGIDRIDQRALPLSTTFSYNNTGAGVTAYIIDTGIRASHSEFGGRVLAGHTTVSDGNGTNDCNGHGTHVAGTVGGATYGVAKSVTLVPVRVLGCAGSGSWSGVIAGIEWVIANHPANQPAVANLSLGGGASNAVDTAVRNLIADDVATAVAAGNGNKAGIAQDACKYSPARVPEAMTIGATTQTDAKTSWSNYGACVDFFAPGAGITSAWNDSDTETHTISGTSMASPHAAGAAALLLQSTPSLTPALVRSALYTATTKSIVTSSRTANNHLLFTDK
jgi:subtilisin family serine protease